MNHALTILLEIPDTFVNWAFTQFPIMALCLTLMILTGWTVWWIRGFFSDFRLDFHNVQTDCGQLKKSQIRLRKSIVRLRTSHVRLEKTTTEIAHRLEKTTNEINFRLEKTTNEINFRLDKTTNEINLRLDKLISHLSATNKIDADAVRSLSPIELTVDSMKMLIDMGGKDYIDTYFHSLLTKMEERHFESGLDVQDYCRLILFDKFDNKELVPIRNFIFNHPVYNASDTVSITLNSWVAISIMGIYLRNKYFEKHPELLNGTENN